MGTKYWILMCMQGAVSKALEYSKTGFYRVESSEINGTLTTDKQVDDTLEISCMHIVLDRWGIGAPFLVLTPNCKWNPLLAKYDIFGEGSAWWSWKFFGMLVSPKSFPKRMIDACRGSDPSKTPSELIFPQGAQPHSHTNLLIIALDEKTGNW